LRKLVDSFCFVCGPDNPKGLQIPCYWDEDQYVAEFTPDRYHQGHPGITHGGIIASLFDEVMGKSLIHKGLMVVTAELNIKYIKPLPIGQPVIFRSNMREQKNRAIKMAASATFEDGTVAAEAEAVMIIVEEEDI